MSKYFKQQNVLMQDEKYGLGMTSCNEFYEGDQNCRNLIYRK